MSQHVLSAPTLIDTVWRGSNGARYLRYIVLAVVGTGLIVLSARIQVPFWPVPMTMQTFAILVIGMAYGARLGGATVLLYLAEGALGLPVFAGGGGIAYFTGPTTGYLVGFLAAAVIVGALAERGWDRSVSKTLLANTLGTLVIFIPGVLWLAAFLMRANGLDAPTGLMSAWTAGALPFLAGAAAKIALAAAVMPLAWRLVGRRAARG